MSLLKKCQSGFVALFAIVLLVMFSLAGVYMLTQFNTSAISSAISYLGIQGWFAARSGSDWAIYQALHLSNCPASTTFTINGFSVTVSCTATPVTEGPDSYTVYDISSRASKGTAGEVTFVSRTVNTSITDAT